MHPRENPVTRIATSLVRDIASSLLPGSGSLVDILSEFKRRKIDTAQQILLEEIRSGVRPLTELEADEFIPMAYTFYKAAEEGARNRNLRLLAKLINKQLIDSDLNSDEYQTLQINIKTLSLILLRHKFH